MNDLQSTETGIDSFQRSPLARWAGLSCSLLLVLGLTACGDEASTDNAAGGEPAVTDASGDDSAAPTPSSTGALVEQPPLRNTSLETVRGAMRWRSPEGWVYQDTSGKPFVAAEYFLPGHREDVPAMCRMSNGSKPSATRDAAIIAEKRVGNVKVKTQDGKSLRSSVERVRRQLGQFEWFIGSADGYWYDDGTMINPRDPPAIIEGYTAIAVAPIIPGPPFEISCWGPSDTIKSQRAQIDGWLASIELDPIEQSAEQATN